MNPEKVVFSEVTGDVIESGKTTETYVSGSGGLTRPVSISSIITTKDQIFLMLPNGKEHALNLSGFSNLACRPGHTITTVFAQSPRLMRKPLSPWAVAVHNHNTQQTTWNWAHLEYYGSVSPLTILVALFGTWSLFAAIGVLIGGQKAAMWGILGGGFLGFLAGWAVEKRIPQARALRLRGLAEKYLEQILAQKGERRAG